MLNKSNVILTSGVQWRGRSEDLEELTEYLQSQCKHRIRLVPDYSSCDGVWVESEVEEGPFRWTAIYAVAGDWIFPSDGFFQILAPKVIEASSSVFDAFFAAIAHGDNQHRNWLNQAVAAFRDGDDYPAIPV